MRMLSRAVFFAAALLAISLNRIAAGMAAALFVAVVIAAPALALAQTVDPSTSVPASGLFDILQPYVVDILGVVITAAVAWGCTWLRQIFGLTVDKAHRDALETGLANAAGLIVNKAGAKLSGKSIPVGSGLLADGIVYVMEHVPEAIAYFGLSPDAIARKVLAKLPMPPQVSEGDVASASRTAAMAAA